MPRGLDFSEAPCELEVCDVALWTPRSLTCCKVKESHGKPDLLMAHFFGTQKPTGREDWLDLDDVQPPTEPCSSKKNTLKQCADCCGLLRIVAACCGLGVQLEIA